MYARLRDPSVSVRKNAVLVLSHLILNDMMKVQDADLTLVLFFFLYPFFFLHFLLALQNSIMLRSNVLTG